MKTSPPVRRLNWVQSRPRGLFVIAAAITLFLSLGCGKKVEVGKNGPAPGPIEPPNPPNELIDQTIRGQLQFGSLPSHLRQGKSFEGLIVGDGGDRRRYIGGHPISPQRAIWHFDDLPQRLKSPDGDVIPAKLTCSIFRLEPGPVVDENGVPVDPPVPPVKREPAARGLPVCDPVTHRVVGHTLQKNEFEPAVVSVWVVSHTCALTPPSSYSRDQGMWQWADQVAQAKYQALEHEYRINGIDLRTAKPNTDGWKTVNQLAEDFGYYELRFRNVVDLKETNIDLPAGVFRNALKDKPDSDANGKPKRSLVSIYVKCETSSSLLGVAESDLYIENKKGDAAR